MLFLFLMSIGETEIGSNLRSAGRGVVNQSQFVFTAAFVVIKIKSLIIFSICFIWKFDLKGKRLSC